ncbi:hypothetical protein RJ641_017531 [Dillenia turbinata]|uniref:Protein NUCLEAR FUSION DEFECTIVE 6, chloroplastic/mitochondrial-like n=1 Tax=Dillenia turbinata TaxID=194707 RepID=A0AAN8YXT5_9MAGN
MAFAAAARSAFRSTSTRTAAAAARVASNAKPSRTPFGIRSSNQPLSNRFFRCPAELSVCVESMLPYHTATASALMTSMLSISQRSYGWLPEGMQSSYFTSSALCMLLCQSWWNVFNIKMSNKCHQCSIASLASLLDCFLDVLDLKEALVTETFYSFAWTRLDEDQEARWNDLDVFCVKLSCY